MEIPYQDVFLRSKGFCARRRGSRAEGRVLVIRSHQRRGGWVNLELRWVDLYLVASSDVGMRVRSYKPGTHPLVESPSTGLYHHRNDPRVKADVYFYVHDTTTVADSFPSLFAAMSSCESDEVRHPPPPFANICVFGSGVAGVIGFLARHGFCLLHAYRGCFLLRKSKSWLITCPQQDFVGSKSLWHICDIGVWWEKRSGSNREAVSLRVCVRPVVLRCGKESE